MIIYSLLSAQNVWINSCECFGLREVQKSTCTSSMHEFELLIHRWGLAGILICHWSNYKWKHNSFYKMFMAAFIFVYIIQFVLVSSKQAIIRFVDHASQPGNYLQNHWLCVPWSVSLLLFGCYSFTAPWAWSCKDRRQCVVPGISWRLRACQNWLPATNDRQTDKRSSSNSSGLLFSKKTNHGSDCPLNDTHRLGWRSHYLGL